MLNDAALEAGPEASDPLVRDVGALTALPAPPRPVAMYCCLGATDGCGSTMLYLDETDILVYDVAGMCCDWVMIDDIVSYLWSVTCEIHFRQGKYLITAKQVPVLYPIALCKVFIVAQEEMFLDRAWQPLTRDTRTTQVH